MTPAKRIHHYPLACGFHAEEYGPTYMSLEHDYLWVGTDKTCWTYEDRLRTLRKIHARLGEIIKKRTRSGR